MNEQSKRSSKQWVNDMLREHYRHARQAKEDGQLVCWSTSIAPQELLTTMGIITMYPENHAAAIGARKDTEQFIHHTEQMGYSSDLCSYARVNLAYAELQHSEAENMPLPDFLLCTSNICHTVIKWYENLAKELNIPLILFDTPFNHTDEVQEHNVKYMEGQLYHIIDQLEEITGKKFDYDKLREVMAISNETCSWWKKATELAAAKPSPLDGFELFNYLAIIVFARGTEEARDLFHLWHDELAEKIRLGQGPPWAHRTGEYRDSCTEPGQWPLSAAAPRKALPENGPPGPKALPGKAAHPPKKDGAPAPLPAPRSPLPSVPASDCKTETQIPHAPSGTWSIPWDPTSSALSPHRGSSPL